MEFLWCLPPKNGEIVFFCVFGPVYCRLIDYKLENVKTQICENVIEVLKIGFSYKFVLRGSGTLFLAVYQRFWELFPNAPVFGLRANLAQIEFLLGGSCGGLRVVCDSGN